MCLHSGPSSGAFRASLLSCAYFLAQGVWSYHSQLCASVDWWFSVSQLASFWRPRLDKASERVLCRQTITISPSSTRNSTAACHPTAAVAASVGACSQQQAQSLLLGVLPSCRRHRGLVCCRVALQGRVVRCAMALIVTFPSIPSVCVL